MSAVHSLQKPEPIEVDFGGIPASLAERPHWVLWRFIQKDNGKWTKPPYQANGKFAMTDDDSTYATFDQVRNAYQSRQFDGIGIVLRDGICGIDLDHILSPDGSVEAWAKEIIERFAGTYIEMSPSGDGFHILAKGTLVDCGKVGPDNRLEYYDQSSNRYFTMTGQVISEANEITDQQEAIDWLLDKYPKAPHTETRRADVSSLNLGSAKRFEDDEILDRARKASNGEKFTSLYDGHFDNFSSQSEADQALCNQLAYWTQDDVQIDRLFRQSGLFRLEKWDKAHYSDGKTYGQMTIANALASDSAKKGAEAADARTHEYAGRTSVEDTFPIIHVADLLSTPKPVSWLIEGFLAQNTLNQVFGPSASGKSFVAIDWACSVATGNDWNGHTVTKGPVFYIAGEGEDGLAHRVAAWEQNRGCEIGAAPFFVIPQPVSLLDKRNAQTLSDMLDRYVEKHGSPRLVVIDTLARNFGDGDENSSADVGRFNNNIDALRRRFGCAVLVVHHTGKSDKSQARGSTALRAAMHHEYCVDDSSKRRTLECTKNKEGPKPPPLNFRLESVTLKSDDDYVGEAVTSAVPVWSDVATEKNPADDLTPASLVALNALKDAVEFDGVPPDENVIAGCGLFSPAAVVPQKVWKDAAIRAGISAGTSSSQGKAFCRAVELLKNKNLIGNHGDFYWVK